MLQRYSILRRLFFATMLAKTYHASTVGAEVSESVGGSVLEEPRLSIQDVRVCLSCRFVFR